MRFVLCFLFVCAFPALAAQDFESLKSTKPGVVEKVIDPLTLALKDGRIVRLAGLHMPDFDPADPGPHALAAMTALRTAFDGQEVDIYGQDQNRMGHIMAHVVKREVRLHVYPLNRNDKPQFRLYPQVWAQGLLLTQGLAQVRTTADDTRFAADMLQAESPRTQGVWADYPILMPDSIREDISPAFRIVEGTVTSVALRQNKLYVNFGSDWRTDMTICIPDAPARRRFAKAGLNPLNWGGQHIRARGWLRMYNGPYMEVDHPQAIELLEGDVVNEPHALHPNGGNNAP